MVEKLNPTKKESYRKYNIVTVLSSTYCRLKLSKEDSRRLKEIKNKIIELYKEQKEILETKK